MTVAPPPPSPTTSRVELRFAAIQNSTDFEFCYIDEASGTTPTFTRAPSGALRDEFMELADEWHERTDYLSSPSQIAMDFAYQGIIGMGSGVIPLIIEDLGKRGGEWYWALKALTRLRTSPIPPDAQGDADRMNQAWIKWLRQNHYIG